MLRFVRDWRAALACVLFVLTPGCAARFRTPARHVSAAPSTAASRPPAWTLSAPRNGEWVYERIDMLQDPPDLPVFYPRQTRTTREIQSALIGVPLLPIESYLRRPGMTPEEQNALPKLPMRARAIAMIEIEAPMPFYPAELPVDRPALATSPIGGFNRAGYRVAYGLLEREVFAEGIEDVTCPAGVFRDCKRIRVALRFRFEWGPTIDATEYLWLADGLGEVQRIEHIVGWFVLIPVESAYRYSLVSFTPAVEATSAASPPAAPAPEGPKAWSRVLVTFDRVFPQPSVSGMYVELVRDGAVE